MTLLVDDVVELAGDLVVHPTEVEPVEPLLTFPPQLVEQLSDAGEAVAVPIAQFWCIIRRSAALTSPWYSSSSVSSSNRPSPSSSKPCCVPSHRE